MWLSHIMAAWQRHHRTDEEINYSTGHTARHEIALSGFFLSDSAGVLSEVAWIRQD